MEDDEEFDPTEDEVEVEESEEPLMMQHAAMWDDFLDYVFEMQDPWAKEDEDTDIYRKMRAVRQFNTGVLSARLCCG